MLSTLSQPVGVVVSELKYPIFVAVASCTEDTYWKTIFNNLARGKTPRTVTITDGYLYCNLKASKFNYAFAGKPAPLLYQELHALFSSKLGLTSARDRQLQHETQAKLRQNISAGWSENWRSIRKKDVKEVAIENFILEKRREYQLTIEAARSLYTLINCYQTLKIIDSTDITYEGGIILAIAGLEFTTGNYHFTPVREIKIKKAPASTAGKRNCLYLLWEKFYEKGNSAEPITAAEV